MSKRVHFRIGEVKVEAEFNESLTAKKILAALPIESVGDYWGGEIYFEIPVECPVEKTAREVVEPGTVAYWPEGACLCLFWGPTPASEGSECRAASKVNLVGKVLNPDVLRRLRAHRVRVEPA